MTLARKPEDRVRYGQRDENENDCFLWNVHTVQFSLIEVFEFTNI